MDKLTKTNRDLENKLQDQSQKHQKSHAEMQGTIQRLQ